MSEYRSLPGARDCSECGAASCVKRAIGPKGVILSICFACSASSVKKPVLRANVTPDQIVALVNRHGSAEDN